MLHPNGVVFIGGSPDENAPELNELISNILSDDEIPETYKPGFSDVRKYYGLLKSNFKSVQFYRFINPIEFPSLEYFISYLISTTLIQGLEQNKRKHFITKAKEIIKMKNNFCLTKVVDCLRASNQ